MTRTQATLAAIRQELELRQALLDGSNEVISVTITVKLTRGTSLVRGVVYQDERLASHREVTESR